MPEDEQEPIQTTSEDTGPDVELSSEVSMEDDEDVVHVNDNYVRGIAKADYDNPSVKPFFSVVGLVCLIGLIWLVVSVEGLTSLIAPYVKALLRWLGQFL